VLCFKIETNIEGSVQGTTYSYFKTKTTALLWLSHPDQEVDAIFTASTQTSQIRTNLW
jgi:hypothetical protein